MSVPSIVYPMPDDKSLLRGRPESRNAGFGRTDSFMPTNVLLLHSSKKVSQFENKK